MSLSNGYWVAVWDDESYVWIAHIQGTPIHSTQAVELWDVCNTKISQNRTWDQS